MRRNHAPVSWTIDSLKAHIDDLLDQRDARHAEQAACILRQMDRVGKESHDRVLQVREETRAALESAEKAITKAETATEKRFDAVNEFREQLRDQSSTFMPRVEAEQRIAQLAEKLDGIEARMNSGFASLGSRLDLASGAGQGYRNLTGLVFGAASFVSALVAIVYAVSK